VCPHHDVEGYPSSRSMENTHLADGWKTHRRRHGPGGSSDHAPASLGEVVRGYRPCTTISLGFLIIFESLSRWLMHRVVG